MSGSRFRVIVADPPWRFGDRLTMSATKRGADANYATMSLGELVACGDLVSAVAAPDAILALWVPSSMMLDGCVIGEAWGFGAQPKTVYTWVKQNPETGRLAFGMGHTFRGCTEHAFIFRRGKIRSVVRDRRNALLHRKLPHSSKPENLQDDLDAMFPDGARLELFARRSRAGWVCTGLECDGMDVRNALRMFASRLNHGEQVEAPQSNQRSLAFGVGGKEG